VARHGGGQRDLGHAVDAQVLRGLVEGEDAPAQAEERRVHQLEHARGDHRLTAQHGDQVLGERTVPGGQLHRLQGGQGQGREVDAAGSLGRREQVDEVAPPRSPQG
jgi:hypothetical protein